MKITRALRIGSRINQATTGSVLFVVDGKLTQDNPNFFWDDTNNRLGLGTATPASKLQINNYSSTDIGLIVKAASGQSSNLQEWHNSAGNPLSVITSQGLLKNTSTYALDTGTMSMIELSPTAIPTGSANFYFYRGGTTISSGTDHYGNIATMRFELTKSGGGLSQNVLFVNEEYIHTGSGQTSYLYGHKMYINRIGDGLIDNTYGTHFELVNSNTTNKFTNVYGNYVKSPNNSSGVIDNFYSFYSEDVISATNAYSIYTNAGDIKLMSSGSDKLGIYGATPVIQHSSTGETVGFTAGVGTAVNDDSTFTGNIGTTAYTISDIIKALKNIGLIAQ